MTEQKQLTFFDLLHAVKAAGNVAEEERIIIFGSNAIVPWLTRSMKLNTSMDIDITFFNDEKGIKTNNVDGAIGELSNFHQTFGYWVHGVSIDETRFPMGWKDRLVKLEDELLDGKVGYLLSPSDLCAVKLSAGREKDIHFVSLVLKYDIADEDDIQKCINLLSHRKTIAEQNLRIAVQIQKKIQRKNTIGLSL